jgi:hypothetical protein
VKKVLIAAALIALFNPISAAALQTEVDVQGITRMDERTEWARHVARVQARLKARTAARMEARQAEATAEVTYAPGEGALSAERVAHYARLVGFPESVIPTMVAIAWRESRFNPGAVNPFTGACGLWQMYPCPGPEAFFPATNAAMAYAKYQASGLSPWGY